MELSLSAWLRRQRWAIEYRSGANPAVPDGGLSGKPPSKGVNLPVAGVTASAERDEASSKPLVSWKLRKMKTTDVSIDRVIAQLQELNETQSPSRARELRQQIQTQINILLGEEPAQVEQTKQSPEAISP